MLFAIGFLMGLVVSFIVTIYLTTRALNKQDQEDREDIHELMEKMELIGSVKYRYKKIEEITDKQLDLVSRVDRPSASAAHSRYKNDIVGQLKALEDEKVDIMRSIVDDGIDPNITISIDGEPQSMKMSEAINMHDINNKKPFTPPPKTESIKTRNNGLRLIHNSEDNNVKSGDPEIH